MSGSHAGPQHALTVEERGDGEVSRHIALPNRMSSAIPFHGGGASRGDGSPLGFATLHPVLLLSELCF